MVNFLWQGNQNTRMLLLTLFNVKIITLTNQKIDLIRTNNLYVYINVKKRLMYSPSDGMDGSSLSSWHTIIPPPDQKIGLIRTNKLYVYINVKKCLMYSPLDGMDGSPLSS